MSRICSVCEKGRMGGNLVSHSNRKTPRVWKANLHKVKVLADNGSISYQYVCSKCLKGGKITRAE